MRSTPVAGYGSKTEAVLALRAQGFKTKEIAEKVGSTAKSVDQLLYNHRKKAARESGNADTRGIWTPEKIDKARRLFGKTMIYIAEALQVPADELLHYALDGEIPPMGKAQRIGMLRNRHEERQQDVPEPQAQPPLQLAAPAQEVQAQDGGGAIEDKPEAVLPASVDANANADTQGVEPEDEGVTAGETAPIQPKTATSFSRVGTTTGIGSARDASAMLHPGVVDGPTTIALQAGTVVTAGETAPNSSPSPLPRAEMPMAASVQQRFRLRDETGQYLHEHERGMTRLARFYWRGTEAQIASLMRKKPHLRQLEREECL